MNQQWQRAELENVPGGVTYIPNGRQGHRDRQPALRGQSGQAWCHLPEAPLQVSGRLGPSLLIRPGWERRASASLADDPGSTRHLAGARGGRKG